MIQRCIPALGLLGVTLLFLPKVAFAQIVTPNDRIPDFCGTPTITSARTGNWIDTGTWNLNRVPTTTDVVQIAAGHTVTFNAAALASVDCLGIHGRFVMDTTANRSIKAANYLVYSDGEFQAGTAASPVPSTVNIDIAIANKALDTTNDGNGVFDPSQYGTAFLSLGKVTMHGAAKNPTFVRLASSPRAGNTTFALAQAVNGWQVGDQLVLPDSRQEPTEDGDGRLSYRQLEVRTLQSISADNQTITFSPALTFNHPCTTDEDSNGQPDFCPHVANLTRNVVVHSESRTGTRGHVMFTNRATIDVRYAAFEGLGRTTFNDLNSTTFDGNGNPTRIGTNQIGRYSLHLHHLMGPSPTVDPEYQYRLVGNSVYENSATTPEQKWGITLHNTHYGLVQNNVMYNIGGAGLVTEDGSESNNVIENNFVAKITSNGGRDEHFDSTRGIAREGVGYWFRGPNNYVRGNVAANMGEDTGDVEASYGFKYSMMFLGNIRVPNSRGADTSVTGQYTTRNGNGLPLLEFANNEMYGQIQGLTIWWLCSVDTDAVAGCGKSVLSDTVMWHVSRYAYYGYPANNYEFNGLKVYGDASVLGSCCEFKSIFWFGDYATKDLLVRNARFYNTTGLTLPYFADGFVRVENSFFKTNSGIVEVTSGAPGSCPNCNLPDPDAVLVDNQFAAPAGRSLRTISMDYDTHNGLGDPANNDRVFSCNHNLNPADDFEVFFSAESGAPCTTTRADIPGGYVCVTARVPLVCGVGSGDSTPPTVAITAPANNATVTGTQNVAANAADNIAVVGVQFKLDGNNLGAEDVLAPYAASWDTGTASNGSHTLTAVARDAAGNTTTSTTVNVTVNNVPNAPPTITVTPNGPFQVRIGQPLTFTVVSTDPDGDLVTLTFPNLADFTGATFE